MKTITFTLRLFSLLILTGSFAALSAQNTSPIVRLKMSKAGFFDETVFYFQQGGTPEFQPAYDAYKLVFTSKNYLASLSGTILTSINGLPELSVNSFIPVKAICSSTGHFTFSAIGENFPDGVCVTLFDKFTGVTTNILKQDYMCMLYDTTSSARFTMNFFTGSNNMVSKVTQPACSSPEGMIVALGDGNGPWNYEWRKDTTLIRTFTGKTADSIPNLQGGNYSVKVTAAGCSQASGTFVINSIVPASAEFESDVTTTSMSRAGLINFSNQSPNHNIHTWNFGDKSGTFFGANPSHNYTAPGTYTVTLISKSSSQCVDTMQQLITVLNDITTGVSELSFSNTIRLMRDVQGNYTLGFSFDQSTDLELRISDLKGTLLTTSRLDQVSQGQQLVDMSSYSSGMYLLQITDNSNKGISYKLLK